MPLQYRARQFSADDIQTMRALPVSITLEGLDGNDVLVCHASLQYVQKPNAGIDSQLEQELQAVNKK
jgi:hypothetical protein